MVINDLITYLAIFFGVMLEGEIALLASSLAASKGILNLFLVSVIAFSATLVTDWSFFFLGKYSGAQIFKRFRQLEAKTTKPRLWIRKNPDMILLFYRFLYGFRIITLLILGMSKVSVKRFMVLSFIATTIWTILFSVSGYFMGEVISRFIVKYESFLIYLITGLISAGFLLLLIRTIIRKALQGK